jgi:membrane-bound ClpP family serine protease
MGKKIDDLTPEEARAILEKGNKTNATLGLYLFIFVSSGFMLIPLVWIVTPFALLGAFLVVLGLRHKFRGLAYFAIAVMLFLIGMGLMVSTYKNLTGMPDWLCYTAAYILFCVGQRLFFSPIMTEHTENIKLAEKAQLA